MNSQKYGLTQCYLKVLFFTKGARVLRVLDSAHCARCAAGVRVWGRGLLMLRAEDIFCVQANGCLLNGEPECRTVGKPSHPDISEWDLSISQK